jgi:hypothetical protein
MAPPQLSGNAPIPQITDPSVPVILILSGQNLKFLGFYNFEHGLFDFAAVDPPLRPDHWLYYILAPLAESQPHLIVLLLLPQANLFQFILNGLPRMESLHACELATIFVDEPVISEDVNEFQLVLLPTGVIVGVVCRCNLHGTSSELLIYKRVGYYLHLAFGNKWMQ